ncbi:MAG: glycosyltransferase family 9 protein [Pseudomonadota bacterium]
MTTTPAAVADPDPIERIVVFRALALGDLLCATPALRALHAGFPNADITLVGLPGSGALTQRLPYVHEMLSFPGYPGLPESTGDLRELPDFLAHVQTRRFDLAVQLHGSGEIVNPLVAAFGARRMAGFDDGRTWSPPQHAQWMVRWPEHGHEIERLLALTDGMGLPRKGTHLDFPLQPADREALNQLWPGAQGSPKPYVCVHPGSQLPSRRWPLERFAAVGDALVAAGYTVVLTGTAPEAPLVNSVAHQMQHKAVNLVGLTDLWTLGALIEKAHSVVCNDTGVSHIAAALRRPSVVINSGGEVERWRPLDTERHQVLWHDVPCRPCLYEVCPTGHACAQGVEVDSVLRRLDLEIPGIFALSSRPVSFQRAVHA